MLTVERRGARVDIYFRRGRVDLAIADGLADEFLLGRFVLDAELDVARTTSSRSSSRARTRPARG